MLQMNFCEKGHFATRINLLHFLNTDFWNKTAKDYSSDKTRERSRHITVYYGSVAAYELSECLVILLCLFFTFWND